jgi:transcriptional regulator with XRE-family HTH domain
MESDGGQPNMEKFGHRLRRLRGSRSQKEIAEALKMPPTTLSSLEAQESIPRGDMLRKLSDFFRVPVTYFYAESHSSLKPTDAARQYLKRLREPAHVADTVATQSNAPLDDAARRKIFDLIRRKSGEISDK